MAKTRSTKESTDRDVRRHEIGLLDALVRRNPERAKEILDRMKALDEKRAEENTLDNEDGLGLDS